MLVNSGELLILLSWRIFHTSVSLRSFAGVWVAASFFRTLLTFLADLKNVVVWMVSILPLIPNSSSLSSKRTTTICKVQVFVYLSAFMLNLLSAGMIKSINKFLSSFFFFSSSPSLVSGWDYVIRWYLKIPGNCTCLLP